MIVSNKALIMEYPHLPWAMIAVAVFFNWDLDGTISSQRFPGEPIACFELSFTWSRLLTKAVWICRGVDLLRIFDRDGC